MYLREDQHHHWPSETTKSEENEDQSHRSCQKAGKQHKARLFSSRRKVWKDAFSCPWGYHRVSPWRGPRAGFIRALPIKCCPFTISLQMYSQSGNSSLWPAKHIFKSFPPAEPLKVKDFTGTLLDHDSQCSSSLTLHPPQQMCKTTPAPLLHFHSTAM